MSDIAAWLENLELGKYQAVFAENDVDFEVLSELTEQDLEKLGISLGHRKKLLKAMAVLSDDGASTTTANPPPATSQAERRQLTVMFVDLVGSTELSGQLDPEDMRELILGYQNAVAGEIIRFEGYVAKYMGDGVLAYFGWPRAHEDEAERAVRAGLAVTVAVAKLSTPDGAALATRSGIATGLVVVGDLIGEGASQEQAVVGETPNLAARLQALAEPSAVVISDSTRHLLGDVFELQTLGLSNLKGIAAPVEAYQVCGERAAESRYQAQHAGTILPMMGREHELAQIKDRWQQAKNGEGQMILLTGEAGIGKSRILHAVNDALTEQPHYRINYQCSPYHTDSALYPVIQNLTRAAAFADDDDNEAKLDKLKTLLDLVPDKPPQSVALVAALLSLDAESRYGKLNLTPQQQRTQTLQALVMQLMGLAQARSVLFMLEDAHWIDPTTLELIDLSLDAIKQASVLLLITARPTFAHQFGGHPIVTRIMLNRLGREPSLDIIERLSGGKTLPGELLDEILRKTDGVPLFVEELTKTVLESGLLHETDDAYLLNGPLRSIDIPSSLHDSLLARLDRLQSIREVVQMAACIGREFSYGLLTAVAQLGDEKLQAALEQLIEAELMFRRGLPPDAVYTFKHALVRDAAYESLLKSKRQQIHAQLLAALEPMADSAPELLAHHATEAALIEQAVNYWQQAGERAIQRSANAEAISQLSQAIELLEQQAESAERNQQELDLQIAISAPLLAAKGFSSPELVVANTRARDLCEVIGQTPKIIPALSNLQRYYNIIGQPRRADKLSQESYRILQQSATIDPAWIAIVANNVGATAMMRGDFDTALHYEQHGVEHCNTPYRETQILVYGEDMGITCRGFLAIIQWCLGYPDQAQSTIREARERAYQFSHTFSIAWTDTFSLYVLKFLRSVEALREKATATHAFSVEHGLPSFEGLNLVFRAWSIARQDQSFAAVAQMEQLIATFDSIGFKFWGGYFRSLLAESHQAVGQTTEAVRVIDEAIEYTDRFEEGLILAEVHRLKGELLLQQANPDISTEAESCFLQSLSIARKQQAKSWELRAAASLARFWRDQGKRREAHDLLAPVYSWFTEGFDTVDLKDAKALLNELT